MHSVHKRKPILGPLALGTGVVLLSACGSQTPISQILAAEGGQPLAGQQSAAVAVNPQDGGVASAAPDTSGGTVLPSTSGGTVPSTARATTSGGQVRAPTQQGAAPVVAVPGASAAAGSPTVGKAARSTKPGTTKTSTAPAPVAAKGAAGAAAPVAPVAPVAPAGAAGSCTKQLSPIRIGQVGGWTGLVSEIYLPTKTAMQVWVQDTNARGGVACHPIELFQEDDGSDPSRASSDVQDLVRNKNVVALVGNQVVLSMSGFQSQVDQLGVPAVGGDLLSERWFQDPLLFPQGGDLTADVLGPVSVQAKKGLTKVAGIYCVEAKTCTDAKAIVDANVGKTGASLVYETNVSITQTDYSAQCQAAKSAGATQILAALDGASISRMVKNCKALGYTPGIGTSPIAIGSTVTSDPNIQADTLSVGGSTAPWTETGTAAQQRYHAALAKYAPGTPADGATNVAWASGELLAAAINGLSASDTAGTITPALVLKGLATIKNNDLGGLTIPLTFTAGTPAPVRPCYYPQLLTTQGWLALDGNNATCY